MDFSAHGHPAAKGIRGGGPVQYFLCQESKLGEPDVTYSVQRPTGDKKRINGGSGAGWNKNRTEFRYKEVDLNRAFKFYS